MCVVSMVGDHFHEKWNPLQTNPYPITYINNEPKVDKKDFDSLKKEVEDMKALLIRAKLYDEKNGEPHCEMEEKIATLRKIAELVGVDLKDIL